MVLIHNCASFLLRVFKKKSKNSETKRWEEAGNVALELMNDYQMLQSGMSKKKIILKPLPFSISGNKDYFTELEVREFLTKHDMHDELQRFESIISNSLDSNQNLIITEQDKSIVGSEVDTIKKGNFLLYFCGYDKCYHGDTSFYEIFCWQQIATAIDHDTYGVSDSLEDLVFSVNYKDHKNDSTIIPKFLIQKLNEALEETKNSLPNSLKLKVIDYSLSLSPKKKYLWIQSDDKFIYVSPYLIRAAFILTMNKYQNILHWYSPLKYGNITIFELGASIDSVEAYNSRMITAFKQSFYFAFGHELAHHYLTDYDGTDDYAELVCDCNSWKYLRESKICNTLGICESMLHSSLSNENDSLWGIKDKSGLKKRFYYIHQLIKFDTLDCTPW
ncbi:MAG: hypothetical protein IPO62_04580 [Saprospiraceae bacterium]|nr:hypothetical protein [Saprospiraceae bacterium]